MEVEKEINKIKERLLYQEQIHSQVTPDGNKYHTIFLDYKFFFGAVIVSSIVTIALIKIMK